MRKHTYSKKIMLMALSFFIASATFAQLTDTTKKEAFPVIERSKYNGVLNATLTEGFLIKTSASRYYIIDEKALVKVNITNPEIVISKNGKKIFITIQGTDKSLRCHREDDVLESYIAGTFSGWNGNTSVKLDNGDEWIQDESGAVIMKNLYRPKTIVYRTNDGYRMKIEGINELMLVKKNNTTNRSQLN